MGVITKVALGKFIRIARGDISNYADVITQAASTAINETAEEGICFGDPEEAPPGDVFINKAFFAEKKVEDVYDETTEEYTVVSGDNLSVIAGEYEGVSYQDIMEENGLTSTEIDVGDKLHITSRTKVGETTRFEQITAGNIGEEVYIVVEHFGTLSSLRATLKEKEPLLTDGGALAVMQDDSEVTAIELCEPEEEELKGIYYYAKIKLRPEEDETLETWREKLQDKELVGYSDTENQRTVSPEAFGAMTPIGMEPIYDTVKSLLSIEVEARAEEGDVVYCGRDRSNVFLNEDGEWFEVGGATCYCKLQGLLNTSCGGKGSSITDELYEQESERLGVESAIMHAIAKQESKRNSFWEEEQATILFERHKMWKYLKEDLGKTDEELKKLKDQYPNIVNNNSGGYGSYADQYEKLRIAKGIDYTSALKSCSWGKFQVMGFNYDVAFETPEKMEKAVNTCEVQQFKFFIGYLENTNGLIQAMKDKDWEKIAEKYNGSSWQTFNPEYADNLKDYYDEFKED
ncbi:N-acetylmuramidase domain-containing protein [Sinomicrobium soli]|uniref:N-acetylmuramidase domain-containing protein n=1 Tax=Sinomicrobium sp. N-1-3-6 TaxID=2219864 RepID=UPI000DCAEC12|nr:N-acetylmuramidase domain-containing protein [Sinomicrobium sp. N-1-3-6]RAV30766.1 hypothetical protein DN748_00460 [Sinomicrobium sp. N-1-3-6]